VVIFYVMIFLEILAVISVLGLIGYFEPEITEDEIGYNNKY
jgi:hypothetical protein